MTDAATLSLVDRLRRLPPEARGALFKRMARMPGALADVRFDWDGFWSRPDQRVTVEELERFPLIQFAGPRGGGKTRAAVQLWLREVLSGRVTRPRIIAATQYDVEDTVINGVSGIMACLAPDDRPLWLRSEGPAGKLRFRNGIDALCFGAKNADQLIGSAGDCDLLDDVAKWGLMLEAVWYQERTSCRIGRRTGILATTDDEDDVHQLLESLLSRNPNGLLVRRPDSVFANRNNLSAGFFDDLAREVDPDRYRQAVYGERIASSSPFVGLRFDADPIRCTVERAQLAEVVVVVDPADGKGANHDDWGVGAAGRRHDRHVVALEDRTGQYSEDEAADAALELCASWGARVIIVEKNRGPRVQSAIKAAYYKRIAEGDTSIRAIPEIIGVTAKDGKRLRADPLRKLYLSGVLHHAAGVEKLEQQQRTWKPDGPKRPRQDDAIDWWVHGVTYLADLGGDDQAPPLDQLEGLAARTRALQGAAAGARDGRDLLMRHPAAEPGDPRAPRSPRRTPSLQNKRVL